MHVTFTNTFTKKIEVVTSVDNDATTTGMIPIDDNVSATAIIKEGDKLLYYNDINQGITKAFNIF